MAQANPNAAVKAANGLGPKTYICSVATGTISVKDACLAITTAPGGATIAGVEGVANGDHIAVQGGATPSVSGVTVVATFG
jgi:hypothetical protein